MHVKFTADNTQTTVCNNNNKLLLLLYVIIHFYLIYLRFKNPKIELEKTNRYFCCIKLITKIWSNLLIKIVLNFCPCFKLI